jgi:hypothetical protein
MLGLNETTILLCELDASRVIVVASEIGQPRILLVRFSAAPAVAHTNVILQESKVSCNLL